MQFTFPFPSLALAAILTFSACAASYQTPYRESDFAWSGGKGTSTIVGRAYVTLKDGSTRYAHNAMVDLVPVNAYTTEWVKRVYLHGEKLQDSDPRFLKYRRSTHTDANGNFVFRNLPAGDYYASTNVVWHYTSTMYVNSTAADGTSVPEDVPDSSIRLVNGKVSARAGQTVHFDVTW